MKTKNSNDTQKRAATGVAKINKKAAEAEVNKNEGAAKAKKKKGRGGIKILTEM